MTKTRHNHHNQPFRPRCVRVTPEIMDYLCVSTKYGASRLKAYLSLVESVAETTTPYTPLYGQSFNLEAGQLVISITEMAERWKWARETVRKFFDQLEDFKLLTKQQLDRCSLITMNIEWLDAEYPSASSDSFPPFEMPKELSDKMDEWLSGDIVDAELIEAIEEVTESFDSADGNVLSHQIAMLQYSLIRQLIQRWSVNEVAVAELPDKVCLMLISELFNSCLSGNWALWLRLLREASPGFSPDSIASDSSNEPSFLIDGRAILDSLFIHLNVDFNREEL